MEARRENSLRKHAGGQKGQTLIEIVVTLALIAILIPTMFAALSAAITSADRIRDRSIVLELAQSQMESIQGQEFRPGGGYDIISHPEDFEISIGVEAIERCPGGEVILQQITITVTGRHGSLTLEGFKVRR
jgi:prepilin-type N-terminal cleavage/methylation domain-containing protein